MEQAWREKIIAPFEQAHPNIHVELSIVPYGLYMQRLLAAAVSGAAAGDVLMMDDWLAVELISRGYALPLDDRAARDLHLNDFYPDILAEWRGFGKGTLAGIPFSAGATVLFYNKTVFDRAHLSYPDTAWTYDDVLRAARAITRDTNGDGVTDIWGILTDNGGYSGFDSYVYANGGTELDASRGRATFADAATMSAVQKWVDLTRVDRVAPQPASISALHAQLFMANRAGMTLFGDHLMKQFTDPNLRWDYTLPPKGPAGRFSRRFDDGFIIPRSSEHPDEAWEFLKWVVTFPPQTDVTSVMEKSTPVYLPLASSPGWYRSIGQEHGLLMNSIFKNYSFTIMGPGWNEWRDNVFVPEIDNAFLGRKTVEQALRDAEVKVNEVLERRVK